MAIPQVYTVNINGVDVPVTADSPDISIPAVMDFVPFINLITNLNQDPLWNVTKIVVQGVDKFGVRVGFVKVNNTATYNGSEKPVPGIAFLRGDSVAVLTILRCNGERWVVCCMQPRMPAGSTKVEIPAGMMDAKKGDEEKTFLGVAAKEMSEETGIELKESDLIDISPNGKACPSIGACDEKIKFYAHIKDVTPEYLAELNGKITGNFDEGEVIRLKLIKYENLHKECDDMKAMTAMLLLERSGVAF
jgi:ADP-sugar diphosphatase